jgi:hypothetical protein
MTASFDEARIAHREPRMTADADALDPLTIDLEKKTRNFLSLVEEQQSPIKSSLSDVPTLKDAYGELRNLARS